jgi:hypothetical protein
MIYRQGILKNISQFSYLRTLLRSTVVLIFLVCASREMAQPTLSNLSDPRFGYDYVIATTQGSINVTLKQFLSGIAEPEVTVCYVADGLGRPTPVDYDELKKRATVDPFSIPDGSDPTTDQNLKKLLKARFMMGFRARIGIPKGTDPELIPDIVTLGEDIRSVTFNLICEEFDVVELSPGDYVPPIGSTNRRNQESL